MDEMNSQPLVAGNPSVVPQGGGIAAHIPKKFSPASEAGDQTDTSVFTKEIGILRSTIDGLSAKMQKTSEESSGVARETAGLERSLDAIAKNEQIAASRLLALEGEERQAVDPDLRHKLEESRWQAANEWHDIGKRKWDIREGVERSAKRLSELEGLYDSLVTEREKLSSRIAALELEKERVELSALLKKTEAKRDVIRATTERLKAEQDRLAELLKQEQKIEMELEHDEMTLEKQMTQVSTLAEERELGENRFEIEKKRHEIEQARWRTEDEFSKQHKTLAENTKELASVAAQYEDISAKLDKVISSPRGSQ